jgi:arylsulfatase A-like enzyme
MRFRSRLAPTLRCARHRWQRRHRRLGAAALLTGIALAACCARVEPPVTSFVRFVDASEREGARAWPATLKMHGELPAPAPRDSSAALVTATIQADTRPVLATPIVRHIRQLAAPAPGNQGIAFDLDQAFGDAPRVVVVGSARLDRVWTPVPARLRDVVPHHGQRVVIVSSPVVEEVAATGGRISLRAMEPPGARTTYRTRATRVLERATLTFAIGLIETGASASPVRFSLSSCRGDVCAPLYHEVLDPTDPGWHERRVSLGELAGETREFSFETERLDDASTAWALPVWGDPRMVAPDAGAPTRPNLILISLDTLRADHLGVYGYARQTSPFLDEFASDRGTVFESLTAASTHTGPSHMSLFTSLPPSTHGVTRGFGPVAAGATTLAEVLRSAGYATAAMTENAALARSRGFGRGFDVFVENSEGDRMSTVGQVETVVSQAEQWLDTHRVRPFFLFLHTYQVHWPYTPPDSYRTYFSDDGSDLPAGSPASLRAAHVVRKMTDYDREIRYVDDALRDLDAWLAARDLLKDTIVFITSDHGEEFGEHGQVGHATLPFQTVVHIPLIVAGPGISPGRRVREPIAQVDFMPTMLDLAGVPTPPQAVGRSFAPSLMGEPEGGDTAKRPFFSEAWATQSHFEPPALAVRVGSRKLIRFRTPQREEFVYFDLAADPTEASREGAGTQEEPHQLRALLEDYERHTQKQRAALGAPSSPEHQPPDPEHERMLRALGYLE